MVTRSLLTALLLTLGLHTAPLQAASFDCSKATTETEITICNDPELSALDDRLSGVYMRVGWLPKMSLAIILKSKTIKLLG